MQTITARKVDKENKTYYSLYCGKDYSDENTLIVFESNDLDEVFNLWADNGRPKIQVLNRTY